jgi:putative transposase
VTNQRQDWTHKVASVLVSGNSLIATEDLNLKGMTRKAKKGSKRKAQKTGLNRSMLDVGIGNLTKAIKYKLQEAGGFLVLVPTKTVKPSQTCPDCGHQRKKTYLSVFITAQSAAQLMTGMSPQQWLCCHGR